MSPWRRTRSRRRSRIVAADAEFSRNACDGARENAKKAGLQDRLRQDLSAGDHRLRADRARDPGHQSRHRRDLLLSAGLGRHGARGQRDRLQAEDDRRRHGRPAGHRDQDAARAAAQRHRRTTTSGCRCRRCSSQASRSSDQEVSGHAPPPKASIRSATTWRRRATRSCRCWNRRSKATKSLDDDKLADYIAQQHVQDHPGRREVRQGGEWAKSRVLQVQFRNIKGNDVDAVQGHLTPGRGGAGGIRDRQGDLSVREGEIARDSVIRCARVRAAFLYPARVAITAPDKISGSVRCC